MEEPKYNIVTGRRGSKMGKTIADIFREALQEAMDETIGEELKEKIKQDEEKEINEEIQKVEKAVREIEKKENKKRDTKMNEYYIVYSFKATEAGAGHGSMSIITEEKMTRELINSITESIKEEVEKTVKNATIVIDNIIKLEQ